MPFLSLSGWNLRCSAEQERWEGNLFVFVLILGGKFQSFLVTCDVSHGLSSMPFIRLKFPSSSSLCIFNHEEHRVLSDALSVYIEMILWFWVLFYWYVYHFQMFNQPCVLGITPTRSWFVLVALCCRTGVASLWIQVSLFTGDCVSGPQHPPGFVAAHHWRREEEGPRHSGGTLRLPLPFRFSSQSHEHSEDCGSALGGCAGNRDILSRLQVS